jgi:ribosomal protein S4E
MPRGPKKHLKRLNAPKHWMLGKLGGIFVSRMALCRGSRDAHDGRTTL